MLPQEGAAQAGTECLRKVPTTARWFLQHAIPLTTAWCLFVAFVGTSPALCDGFYPRQALLAGKWTPAGWFLENKIPRIILLVSLGANGLAVLASLFFRDRRSCILLTLLLASHYVWFANIRSLGMAQSLRDERALYSNLDHHWAHLDRLEIVQVSASCVQAFSAQDIRKSNIQTFSDIHRWVKARYAEHRGQWKEQLHEADEDRLKTAFFMRFVMTLWAFGNKEATTKTGSVFQNEENDWEMPEAVNAELFITSRIGCCTEQAHVLKYLLDQEKIPNRLTSITGHIFNEVQLNGQWCVVDCTCALLIDSSWEEIFAAPADLRGRRIRVTIFPHPNLVDASAWEYRPLVARIQLMTLLRISARPEAWADVTHPTLPDHFRD